MTVDRIELVKDVQHNNCLQFYMMTLVLFKLLRVDRLRFDPAKLSDILKFLYQIYCKFTNKKIVCKLYYCIYILSIERYAVEEIYDPFGRNDGGIQNLSGANTELKLYKCGEDQNVGWNF